MNLAAGFVSATAVIVLAGPAVFTSRAAQVQRRAPVAAKEPRADLPAILIYWTRGYSSTPPPDELQLAVWGDGRIQWREHPREWLKIRGTWQWNDAKFFQAKIPVGTVQKALSDIKAGKADKANGWSYVIVDGSYNTIVVRDGKSETVLRCSEGPLPRGDANAKGRVAWKLIKHVAMSLIPKSGTAIKTPNIRSWRE